MGAFGPISALILVQGRVAQGVKQRSPIINNMKRFGSAVPVAATWTSVTAYDDDDDDDDDEGDDDDDVLTLAHFPEI